MSDFSDFGERTTDAFLAKKVEAEVKKLKTVVTVSHLNYLLCAVYKFTKTLGVKCSSARISPANSPRA
jgi:hypothetical protein